MNRFSASAIVLALVGTLVSPHSFASETAAVNISGICRFRLCQRFRRVLLHAYGQHRCQQCQLPGLGCERDPQHHILVGNERPCDLRFAAGQRKQPVGSPTPTPRSSLTREPPYSITLQNGCDVLLFARRRVSRKEPLRTDSFSRLRKSPDYNSLLGEAFSTDFFPGLNFEYLLVPRLSIVPSRTNVIVSWPASATSFMLQQTFAV